MLGEAEHLVTVGERRPIELASAPSEEPPMARSKSKQKRKRHQFRLRRRRRADRKKSGERES